MASCSLHYCMVSPVKYWKSCWCNSRCPKGWEAEAGEIPPTLKRRLPDAPIYLPSCSPCRSAVPSNPPIVPWCYGCASHTSRDDNSKDENDEEMDLWMKMRMSKQEKWEEIDWLSLDDNGAFDFSPVLVNRPDFSLGQYTCFTTVSWT